jgi:hypothetical protein
LCGSIVVRYKFCQEDWTVAANIFIAAFGARGFFPKAGAAISSKRPRTPRDEAEKRGERAYVVEPLEEGSTERYGCSSRFTVQ